MESLFKPHASVSPLAWVLPWRLFSLFLHSKPLLHLEGHSVGVNSVDLGSRPKAAPNRFSEEALVTGMILPQWVVRHAERNSCW